MGNIIMFCILSAVILGAAILCIITTRIMRAATCLLFVLFGVAGLYFLLGYTYLGAVQISIYAGGVTMIYIFAIQLLSKRALQGFEQRMKGSRVLFSALVTLIGLATVLVVMFKQSLFDKVCVTTDTELPMDVIGKALVGSEKYQYVLPFEFLSVFLLACIVGGILIARRR